MALRWCDSFDYATDDIAYKYGVVGSPTISSTKTRWAGKGALCCSNLANYATYSFNPSITNELYCGYAFYTDGYSGTDNTDPSYCHWRLLAANGSNPVSMKYSLVSAELIIYTGHVVRSTVSCSISAWHYVELWYHYVNGSSDRAIVKIDGITVFDYTGDCWYSSSPYGILNGVQFRGHFSGAEPIYYQDVYVCDTTGSTNNSFLGDVRVQAIRPSGAGNYSQFSPLSGSNYENVDDTDIDGDSSYVSGTIVGVKDTYTMEDISSSRQIFAVASNIVAQKATAGASFLKPTLRISSTDYERPALGFGVGYSSQQSIWETSPATDSAFTGSEVNALESGFTLYASTTTTTV